MNRIAKTKLDFIVFFKAFDVKNDINMIILNVLYDFYSFTQIVES